MRTRKATVSFHCPFTLNRDVGELPPGSYDIEIDEEEIQLTDRTAYRRVAIYFYVLVRRRLHLRQALPRHASATATP